MITTISGQPERFPLLAFLRAELAPRPGRMRAVWRITAGSTLTVVLGMVFQIPIPAYMAYIVFMASREEEVATLMTAFAGVANADNIQVQGEKIGVPVAASVNIGALNAASAAANAVTKAVDDVSRQQQDDARNKMPSVISVQVLGFGDGTGAIDDKERRRRYDPNSPVQVLGAGQLSMRAKDQLTPEERARLTE